jgi:hypothetical protein
MSMAFIFALNSWIYTSPTSPPQAKDVQEGDYSYRIYQPTSNDPLLALTANTLAQTATIPFSTVHGSSSQTLQVARPTIVYPLIPFPPNFGKMQLVFPAPDGAFSPSPDVYLPSNLLRIDVYGGDDESLPSKAQSIKAELMRVIRWRTQQWWVTRDSASLSKPGSLGYKIDALGEQISAIPRLGMSMGARTFSGNEKFLDAALWEQSVADAFSHVETPAHWTQLLDAQYFLAIDDLAQAGLLAASGCDILKERVFEAVWQRRHPRRTYSKTQRNRMISGWQMPEHIDTGLATLLGRSYKTEHPQEWDGVSQLWELRNHVAHGDVPSFGSPPSIATDSDIVRFVNAARHLLKWLEAFL